MKWITNFFELLYPRYCVMCDGRLAASERYVCTSCMRDLPRTNYHTQPDNPLEQLFWGRATVEQATGYFFYYKDNAACRILHTLKYYHTPGIGVSMGRQMALEITPSGFFKPIDRLVPVPLAASKRRLRGYNQCDMLAEGISAVTGIPIDNVTLVRRITNPTQTKKHRAERWENVQGIFAVTHPERLAGKHILLIDDVVTTGATLLSCMDALAVVPDLKISVLTLAVTQE